MKQFLLFISLFAAANTVLAKNRIIYLNEKLEKVERPRDATYFRELIINDDSTVSFKDYYLEDNRLHLSGTFTNASLKEMNGVLSIYSHGNLSSKGTVDKNNFIGKWDFFYNDGEIKEQRFYENGIETGFAIKYDNFPHKIFEGFIKNELEEGYCIFYNEHGKISEGEYLHGKPIGAFKFYYDDTCLLFSQGKYAFGKRINFWEKYDKQGKVICIEDFGMDTLIDKYDSCWFPTVDAPKNANKNLEKEPEFPDGNEGFIEYIKKHFLFSKKMIDNRIYGFVWVIFIVNEDGSLSNMNVVKDIGFGCGTSLKNVLKESPKWNPGYKNGKPVKALMSLPIFVDAN